MDYTGSRRDSIPPKLPQAAPVLNIKSYKAMEISAPQWIFGHCVPTHWRQCPPKSPWHKPAVGQSCHLITLLSLQGGYISTYTRFHLASCGLYSQACIASAVKNINIYTIFICIYSLVSIRDWGFGFTRRKVVPNSKEIICNPSAIPIPFSLGVIPGMEKVHYQHYQDESVTLDTQWLLKLQSLEEKG